MNIAEKIRLNRKIYFDFILDLISLIFISPLLGAMIVGIVYGILEAIVQTFIILSVFLGGLFGFYIQIEFERTDAYYTNVFYVLAVISTIGGWWWAKIEIKEKYKELKKNLSKCD